MGRQIDFTLFLIIFPFFVFNGSHIHTHIHKKWNRNTFPHQQPFGCIMILSRKDLSIWMTGMGKKKFENGKIVAFPIISSINWIKFGRSSYR